LTTTLVLTTPAVTVAQFNLKEKMYLPVNYNTQRCLNKIIKTFVIEDFSHLPPMSSQDQHIKPTLAQLMDQISEKLVLAHIKGS
jgi:hypothetical protein